MSVEDIFNSVTNPKYNFQEQSLPKGSPAFQLVVTDVDKEKKSESNSDNDSNESEEKEKPKQKYHGRRRNTIAHVYGHDMHNFSPLMQRRGSSFSPSPERISRLRSPSDQLQVDWRNRNRTRSLSPLAISVLRRNSIQQSHGVVFGSSRDRETMLQ